MANNTVQTIRRSSTVVELSPHYPKMMGSCKTNAAGTRREKMKKRSIKMVNSSRTVVEHLPHHAKVKSSSTANVAALGGRKWQRVK